MKKLIARSILAAAIAVVFVQIYRDFGWHGVLWVVGGLIAIVILIWAAFKA